MTMQTSVFASGTFEGTGAAVNVSIGWTPDYVKVFNIDAATPIFHEWTSDMAAGTSVDTSAAVANNADNGISAYAGSDTAGSEAGKGITFGTDISVNGETLCWIAFRNSQD